MINITINENGVPSTEVIKLGNEFENLDEVIQFTFPSDLEPLNKYVVAKTYDPKKKENITRVTPLVNNRFVVGSAITKVTGTWVLYTLCKSYAVDEDGNILNTERVSISDPIVATVSENDIDVGDIEKVELDPNIKIIYEELISFKKELEDNEAIRQSNEAVRVANETSRVSAEEARAEAEATRVDNETSRLNAEATRASAEVARATAETNRAEAERLRAEAEINRINAETSRADNEMLRVSAENERVKAETARVEAENAREEVINNLQDTIDSKITKFYATNNGNTHIVDSDNGRIGDMMIYGKAEQFTTTGKNKFKCEHFSCLGINSVNPITLKNSYGTSINSTEPSNSVTVTQSKIAQEDIVTSYENGYFCVSFEPFVVNKNYIFSFDVIPSKKLIEESKIIILLNGNDSVIDNQPQDLQVGKRTRLYFNLTANNTNVTYIEFRVGGVSGIFENFQIEEGSSATAYEPYTGCLPSPSPQYPQEIRSVVNPTIKVTGANILKLNDIAESTFSQNGITFSVKDGVVRARGTATADDNISTDNTGVNHVLAPLKLESGKTYIFNPNPTKGEESNNCHLDFTNSNNLGFSISNGSINNPITVTDAQAEYQFTMSLIVKEGAVIDMEWKPQVLQNESLIPYRPYTEQTITLPITLNAVPVTSGGNATIDGKQYIADYVDVERGKVVRMTSTIHPKEASDMSEWATIKEDVVNFRTRVEGADKKNILSNMLINRPIWGEDVIGVSVIEYNAIDFTLPYTVLGIDQSATYEQRNTAVNAWLKNNDLMFTYILKIPTEEDLTAEQVQKLKALATYYPTTNISTNSEQIDGYTVFNYPISMANGWNYVKQQLNDTRDYIYDIDMQSSEAYVNSEYVTALTELGV